MIDISPLYEEHIHEMIKKADLEGVISTFENEKYINYYTSYLMDLAASKGHLEIVKWFYYNRVEGCTDRAINDSAQNRHLEIVQWLYENRDELGICVCLAQCYCGTINHIYEWLDSQEDSICNKCTGDR